MERQPSYGELVMLSDKFEMQCFDMGVEWLDEFVKDEAYNDFCNQWVNGEDNPEVMLCGYGYKLKDIT